MLRILNVPNCAEIMYRIINFQREILKNACNHDEFNWSEIENLFGSSIKEWLYINRQDLVETLSNHENYFSLTQEEKISIYEAFCHDIDFHNHFAEGDFKFHLDGSRKVIKKWSEKFYDQLKKHEGFPPEVTLTGEKFNHNDWWDAFYGTNSQLTCPVCDKDMNENKSIEHFYPKSRYPALSIHPNNLFPACKNCNEKKGDKDILNFTSFSNGLHPYIHALDEKNHVIFKLDQNLTIVDIQPENSEKDFFKDIFSLPERWQNLTLLRSIQRVGFNQIKNTYKILKIKYPEGDFSYKDILNASIKETEDDWGQTNFAYLANFWIRGVAPLKQEFIMMELGININ